MSKTKIEWTEFSWNPIRGCSRKGPGCENCYAERMAARFSGAVIGKDVLGDAPPFRGFAEMTLSGPRWTGRVELIEHKLDEPLRRRKPTTYFVNSMSDLFHEALPDEARGRVFEIMCSAYWHFYLIFTKRAKEMLDFMLKYTAPGGPLAPGTTWNCAHIAFGVSISSQEDADRDIPILLQTPAAVRMVSYEPALESITLDADWIYPCCRTCGRHGYRGQLCCRFNDCMAVTEDVALIDWLIAGGESGPGARPANPDWFRSVRHQCQAAGVPFFMKQLTQRGRKIPFDEWPEDLRVREVPDALQRS